MNSFYEFWKNSLISHLQQALLWNKAITKKSEKRALLRLVCYIIFFNKGDIGLKSFINIDFY